MTASLLKWLALLPVVALAKLIAIVCSPIATWRNAPDVLLPL